MEYLYFWVTRGGVKPINRKIEAITNMAPPTSQKQVRNFIGVIKYYRNIWPSRSHMLAPLTKLTSIKINLKWTQVKQDAFKEIKRVVARDTLLTYLYFNETFKLCTDASAFQLGAVIIQEGKPIDFYSRKFTDSQQRFTVTEREIIRIVEALKDLEQYYLIRNYESILIIKTLRVKFSILI